MGEIAWEDGPGLVSMLALRSSKVGRRWSSFRVPMFASLRSSPFRNSAD